MIHNDLKWLGTSIFSDSRGGSSGISQGNTVTPANFNTDWQHTLFKVAGATAVTVSLHFATDFITSHQSPGLLSANLSCCILFPAHFDICYLCWKFNANAFFSSFSSTIDFYALDAMQTNQTDKPGENNSHQFTPLSLWHTIMYVNLSMLWRNNKLFCKDAEVHQWSKQLVSEREPLPDLVRAFEWWGK